MLEKLKPCPFCGYSEIKQKIGLGGISFFTCAFCGAIISFAPEPGRKEYTPDQAIEFFNERGRR